MLLPARRHGRVPAGLPVRGGAPSGQRTHQDTRFSPTQATLPSIATCTSVKDQPAFVLECVECHLWPGVDTLHLFDDDGAPQPLADVLHGFIDAELVAILPVPVNT